MSAYAALGAPARHSEARKWPSSQTTLRDRCQDTARHECGLRLRQRERVWEWSFRPL